LGTSLETSGQLWKYNEETDSWAYFSTLPDNAGNTIYSGVIVQNAIYITNEKNEIWTYDLSYESKTWNKKTELPAVFSNNHEGQLLLTINGSNSIFVGLGFSKYLFEYKPLWDN